MNFWLRFVVFAVLWNATTGYPVYLIFEDRADLLQDPKKTFAVAYALANVPMSLIVGYLLACYIKF